MMRKHFFERTRLHLDINVVGTKSVVRYRRRVVGHANDAQAIFRHPRLHLNAIVIVANGIMTNGCRVAGHSNDSQAIF